MHSLWVECIFLALHHLPSASCMHAILICDVTRLRRCVQSFLHISSEAEHGKNWLHETFISIGRRLISSGALGFIFSLSPRSSSSSSRQGKAKRCFSLPVPLSDSVSLLRWNSALSALNVRGRVSFAFPLRSLRHTPCQPSAFLLEAARPFLTLGPLYARRGDKRAEQVVGRGERAREIKGYTHSSSFILSTLWNMEEDFFSYKKRKAISTAGDVERNLISAPRLLENWQAKDNTTRVEISQLYLATYANF